MSYTVMSHSGFIPARPSDVYALLTAFDSYQQWWPRPYVFEMLGPLPARAGFRFKCTAPGNVWWVTEVTELKPPESIVLRYIEGAWQGKSAWQLVPQGVGTRATYMLDAQAPDGWQAALARSYRIRNTGGPQLADIFEAITERLA